MKYIIAILVVNIFIITQNNAQASWAERGSKGASFGIGYSAFDHSNIIGGHLAYTFNGDLTLGLSVGKETSTDVNSLDASSLAIRPHISYFPLKQREGFFMNLGGWLAYQYNNVKIDDFEDASLPYSLKGSTTAVGVTATHVLDLTDRVDLEISGGLSYSHSSLNFDIDDNYCWLYGICDNTEDAAGASLSLGTTMLVSGSDNIFSIAPSLSFSEDETAFRLMIGVFFSR